MRYLLIGNYGVGNVGDDALMEYFLRRFPEVEWMVVSAHPKGEREIPRLPFGFRSLFTPWWRTVGVYWRCDGVVLGGGSLFTDAESAAAPLLWFGHVALAVFFRKPVFLAFQGMGPFRTWICDRCARWAARNAVLISVRDALSFRRVEHWSLNKKCILSFDPVFTLVDASKTCISSNKLLIIPRSNSSREFWRKAEEARRARANASVAEPRTLDELSRVVASASFLLTQRYHAGIVATALGIPFEAVPQVPGDKLDALNREDRDLVSLRERIRVGEEALRAALKTPSPSKEGDLIRTPSPFEGRGQGEGCG